MLNHISYLGSRILLALYAIELGARPFTIGILVALYSLLPLMLSVYAGRLSDRLGHRLPMLAGSILAVFGMLLPWAMPGQTALYASATLIGGGFCFFNIAVQALVGLISAPDTRAYNFSMLTMMLTYARSPEGRAGEANGLRQMANNVTHIFVPLFFGAVGSAFGLTPVFWTNTVLLAVGGYFSRR